VGNILFHLQFPAPSLPDQFTYSPPFEYPAVYSLSKGGSANYQMLEGELFLYTGSTINSFQYARKTISYPVPALTWAKVRTIETLLKLIQSSGGDLEFYAWTGQPEYFNGFGFFVEGNVVYGQCANASSITQIALETIPAGAYTWEKKIKAVLTPGSKVEFYINGIKVGEITTNLPLTDTYNESVMFLRLKNLVNKSEEAHVSMWKISQEA
jgi:hypothetical protein